MRRCKVTFLPEGKIATVKAGSTILDAAEQCGIDIDAPCAGEGTCGKCKVRVSSNLSPLDAIEAEMLSGKEIATGVRLACRAKILHETEVEVLRGSTGSLRILEQGVTSGFKLNPNVQKIYLSVPKPSLEFNQADFERVKMALPMQVGEAASFDLIRGISSSIRNSNHKVTAVLAGNKLIALEEGDTTASCFGVAIDIGTTSLVVSLVNLCTAEEVAVVSSVNPQNSIGEDVISRIKHAVTHEHGLYQLQSKVITAINSLLEKLCVRSNIGVENIYELSIAGNTCMLHLLLGIDPGPLAFAPYVSAFRESLSVKASDLGICIAPQGQIYTMPVISAYVGADIIAGILATGLHHRKDPVLLIDIGTNGEIVIGWSEKIVACSAAAGPAFEGMNIACGMRAEKGAIEGVRFKDDAYLNTIGNVAPIGICGSGLIDLIAELLKKKIIDKSGRLLKRKELKLNEIGKFSRRIIETKDGVRFLLVEKSLTEHGNDIFLTQEDIRNVQLAKGAISAGVRILLKECNFEEDDISEVFIAGAFGYHVRPESLVRIGLIPPSWQNKVTFVGNSAKTGAQIILLNNKAREEANSISSVVNTIELATRPDFEEEFIKAMSFP